MLSDDFDRNSNYNFVPYRNKLVHRKKTNSLESIQDDQTLQKHILPEELHSLGYNAVTSVSNDYVYLGAETRAISTSDTYFDGDNVRGFMEENDYDTIYLRVRALCESGEFYDSESIILNRFTSTTASKEISNSINSLFVIAPNPVNEITTITVLENIEQYSIDIFNLNGQNVYHADGALKLQNNQIELSLSHLPVGVYILTLESPKHTNIIKVLVN